MLGPLLEPPAPAPLLITALVVIVGVILTCAFGVVHEAEHLAHRLGDPYGSLVLTLSIVLIEVILIAAVLLGPGEHATIARDSVMAVSMIILGAVVGLCLLIGGLRHGGMEANRTGTSAYLSLIIVLASLAFALPAVIGVDGSYLPWQEIPIIILTIGIYAFFLTRQMGAQADDFREVDPRLVGERRSGVSGSGDAALPAAVEARGRASARHCRPTAWRSSCAWPCSSSPSFPSSSSPMTWRRCSMTGWAASALRLRFPASSSR